VNPGAIASPEPTPALLVREHGGKVFYEAKWRAGGRQIMKRVGPAWLQRIDGKWQPQRGRIPAGFYDAQRAAVRAAELVRDHGTERDTQRQKAADRAARAVTFRALAGAYLEWAEKVRQMKPSTLASHRIDLAEPGIAYTRRSGVTKGRIMATLGDLPASKVKPADIDRLLRAMADDGASGARQNRVRSLVSAIFSYGMEDTSGFDLAANPARTVHKRPESGRTALRYYRPEEVEAAARALQAGRHRPRPERTAHDVTEDAQDAEAVRVAAFAGLRLGELLALRWRDIEWSRSVLTISRAMSAGIESAPKSGHYRQVPLTDQAAAALDRLSRRQHFTGPDDFVFVGAAGGTLDGSALRRRFKLACAAVGLEPLRWHDLRHSFGSMLVGGGVDVVTVKEAMGHAHLTTTSRYLHARPATETAARFSAVFATPSAASEVVTALPTVATRKSTNRA
jgi:integrase